MYRMIIVDDLPIIVESLQKLFSTQQQIELELYTAYSAMEALDIMRQYHIDIVLTDIRMPVMEGISLLHEIRRLQPHCKVIFLTSYDDFHYAKRALSGGGFEYLLKTEPNEVLVQAVKAASQALDREYEIKRKLYEADMQHTRLLPVVIQNYIREQLQGREPDSVEYREKLFKEWHIQMDAHQPILMLIGRIDKWDRWREEERKLLAYAVQNVGNECMGSSFACISLPYDESKIIWIMQPAEHGESTAAVQAVMNNIQENCCTLLRVSLTLACQDRVTPWKQLASGFDAMRSLLLGPKGAGTGLFLMVKVEADGNKNGAASGTEMEQVKSLHKDQAKALHKDQAYNFSMLRHYLEVGQQSSFDELFQKIVTMDSMEPVSGFYKLELYHMLASLFLSFLNIHPMQEEWFPKVNLDKLFRIDPDASLEEIQHYFSSLASEIFEHRTAPQVQYDNEVVSWINQYIENHLGEDLTVNRLAELVQLNPSYLSRLYKGSTEIGLSDYIQRCRIAKAKQLLKHSNLKIYEIAGEVGYESRLSFIRLFKNMTQMTPQEYRDS